MTDEAPATTGVDTTTDVDTSTVLTGEPDSTAAVDDTTAAADDSTTDTSDNGAQADDNSTTEPPESYADFDLPDGVEIDTVALESASPLLKEMGLTQEQSQKFVTWYAEQVQAGSVKQVEAFNQLTSGWAEQAKNDKEYGGDKFEESIGVAQAAISKLGTPELKQLLDDHGVGNHPEMIRFMVRVGELTREDVPGGDANAVTPEQNQVNLLYPSKSA